MTRLQAKDRVISFGSKINSTWSYCSVRFLETVRSSFQAKVEIVIASERTMEVPLVKWRLGEAGIVVCHERRQERIAGRHRVDVAQPHLLHQAVLQRPVRPLHAALGLRGIGTDDVDVERMQSAPKLRHSIAARRVF